MKDTCPAPHLQGEGYLEEKAEYRVKHTLHACVFSTSSSFTSFFIRPKSQLPLVAKLARYTDTGSATFPYWEFQLCSTSPSQFASNLIEYYHQCCLCSGAGVTRDTYFRKRIALCVKLKYSSKHTK